MKGVEVDGMNQYWELRVYPEHQWNQFEYYNGYYSVFVEESIGRRGYDVGVGKNSNDTGEIESVVTHDNCGEVEVAFIKAREWVDEIDRGVFDSANS